MSMKILNFSKNVKLRIHNRQFSGYNSNFKKNNTSLTKYYCLFGTTSIAILGFAINRYVKMSNVYALQLRKDDLADKAIKLTARERRFIKFASVEFDGQIYMTPQDFLESVIEQEPRPRLKRRNLVPQEIQQLKEVTPNLKHGSSSLFRSLRDKGIISYTEYLFLLSVLTKPQSGFRIAFNMFDTDGNSRVDKNEFLVIRQLLGGSLKDRVLDDNTKEALLHLLSTTEQAKHLLRSHKPEKVEKEEIKPEIKKRGVMEKIFSFAWRGKRGIDLEASEKEKQGEQNAQDLYIDDEQGLQRKHKVDTTLQIHFFGKKGNQDLQFDGFNNFMKNLQTEVLELEFHEFSKGHERISEVDFAKILLRYTYLDTEEYDSYLDRLLNRGAKEKGVSFSEFKQFCQFLNNLEGKFEVIWLEEIVLIFENLLDFSIAMRMYTLADRSISKDEFARAVKICTGDALSQHLVDTVFLIFDEDGDSLLSYKEFIAIMKDRLHRGFKSNIKAEGWVAFKQCLKSEMKTNI
ncbi:unnamed protein product [Diamesa hyperborea]